MSDEVIYLDYAAATPMDERVLQAMQPYFSELFYNPSAPYQPSRDVRVAIELARAKLAKIIGAKQTEIIFTAGATESINLVFSGLLEHGGHAVVSSIEHLAVLETAKSFSHTLTPVDEAGVILTDDLISNIRDDTVLVSIAMVNSEIGVTQNINKISEALKRVRKGRTLKGINTPLFFHTDATQAAGYSDLSITRLGVDLLTLGANKIYGPKQMGLLFKSNDVKLLPLIKGSGHEQNLRSGTENVAGIIGLCRALELATELRISETKRLRDLKSYFVKKILTSLPLTTIIGSQKLTAPHLVMLAWPNLDAERLIFMLERKNILVNTGAACAAKKEGYSHVLKELKIPPNLAEGSLRFSLGRGSSEAQLSRAAEAIVEVVQHEMSRIGGNS